MLTDLQKQNLQKAPGHSTHAPKEEEISDSEQFLPVTLL